MGLISEISVVNRGPIDVASDTDFAGDSTGVEEEEEAGDDENDDDEAGSDGSYEVESSRSEDRVPESRSKSRHDPGVAGGGPKASNVVKPTANAPSTRQSKHGRAELASSPKKVAKQAKVVATNPRKAVPIPRIKMTIPVASA